MASSPDGALAGRLAVVTGGSGGIGHATAGRLAAAGARVILVGRSPARLAGAAASLGAESCAADVATEDGVRRVVEAVRAHAASPDIVVHAAGAFRLAPLAETAVAVFDELVAVNLRATFLLVRAFLPGMLERGSGDIVTIGSVAGRRALPGNGAYAATKFGVRGMHAVLAAELRGTGVRATLVEAAATDTVLWDGIEAVQHADLPPRSAMLAPADVADAVLYAVTRSGAVGIPNILVERT